MVGLTKENIAHIIKQPESISEQQLKSLENLAAQFPFSAFIQAMLTKAYKLSNDIGYHEQLEKAAFSIADRKVLYRYIHRPALIEKIKTVMTGNEVKENEQDLKQTPIKENDAQLIELEKNILSAAINSSIQQEVQQKAPVANPQKNISNKKTVDFAKLKMPLSSWLAHPSKKEPSENKLDTDSIIENYIAGKTTTKSTPFFSPAESAKLSLVDNEEFVTETLAEIHVKQGNYPKAIQIYEGLMLKFPEKNTFFASRIRFIQEKSNYK